MCHDLVTHFQTGALHEDNANDIARFPQNGDH